MPLHVWQFTETKVTVSDCSRQNRGKNELLKRLLLQLIHVAISLYEDRQNTRKTAWRPMPSDKPGIRTGTRRSTVHAPQLENIDKNTVQLPQHRSSEERCSGTDFEENIDSSLVHVSLK